MHTHYVVRISNVIFFPKQKTQATFLCLTLVPLMAFPEVKFYNASMTMDVQTLDSVSPKFEGILDEISHIYKSYAKNGATAYRSGAALYEHICSIL